MKIELLTSEDSNRYLVRHPAEIERVLRDVMRDKGIVAAYGENGKDFLLTAIVAVEPREDAIYLGYGPDDKLNSQLLAANNATFATTHDQVRVQFSCGQVERATHENHPTFRIAMPRELLRLQRREYYRLVTSVVNPVKCMINTEQGMLEALVVDISIGGVGILAYQESGELIAGETFHGCRISLPGSGEFALSLSVCTTFEITLKNGRHTHRAGCQFIDLPPSVETEIQRYIIRVDRERRTRYI
ncbi:MAG: flagellar brake protein [Pseudomonadota bacterium]|nr:flagellar brake protein [Pseudomonadota bacterium]MDP1904299.1 flagellar brake protein [Pseudomonadota bacterium]MDP2351839.1 flagellar brake protein [Pseudomonadota bacterium]